MGRSLLIEKEVEDQVKLLIGPKVQEVGLIIGQLTQVKDYAVHLARCPDPVDDEVEVQVMPSSDDDSEKKNVRTMTAKSGNKSTKHTDAEIDVDPKWIVEHARQVNRMLTGGMSVLGVYMISTPELFAKNQIKLKQCLVAIQKKVENNKSLRKSVVHSEKYLFHVCAASRKFSCRTVDMNDEQASLKPVEFRFQSFLDSWRCVRTCIDINVHCYVPLSKEVCRTEQKIVYACQNEIDCIWNSYAAIGHKILEENDMLEGSKGKVKTMPGDEIDICLFKETTTNTDQIDVENDSVISQVKFVGNILAKAFLHPKATYGEAIKALKVDIIRSLLTRIELLCEEAEVNNLCHVDEWSLMSPARVFGPFKNYNLCFCDYIFKDESEEDSLGRFTELLNLKLPESKLLFPEQSPDASVASMILLGDKTVDHLSDVASEISNTCLDEPRNKKVIAIGVALITALLAVTVHAFSS